MFSACSTLYRFSLLYFFTAPVYKSLYDRVQLSTANQTAMATPRQALRFRAAPDNPALLAARQDPVVTQTITRPYTTATVLVTLGPGESTTSAAPQTTILPTSTTAYSSSTTTSAAVPIPGAPSASSSSLTSAQLGAILGSILGSVLLIFLIWYRGTQLRRRENDALWQAHYGLEDDGSETVSETVEVGGAQRRAAVGGGEPWVMGGGGGGGSAAGGGGGPGIGVVPPPPSFPPTPGYAPYRYTWNPQIRGVRRYP